MATDYDTWKTSEPDEDAREAWIAKRGAELVAEWRKDDTKVREAISDALFDDYDDRFAGLMASLFVRVDKVKPNDPRGDSYMAEAARDAWDDLDPYVEAYLKDQAEGAAATEFDRNVVAAADMRSAA